jgi:hypothetical protein
MLSLGGERPDVLGKGKSGKLSDGMVGMSIPTGLNLNFLLTDS